jgi:hypothetical protein
METIAARIVAREGFMISSPNGKGDGWYPTLPDDPEARANV